MVTLEKYKYEPFRLFREGLKKIDFLEEMSTKPCRQLFILF